MRKFFLAISLHSDTFHANFIQMATLTAYEKKADRQATIISYEGGEEEYEEDAQDSVK